MAEEDILYGKHRHLFGGIEPSVLKSITAKRKVLSFSYTDGGKQPSRWGVEISYELPDDTVINGQTLCTVKGVIIRSREDRYPIDEFDGELVADITDGTNSVIHEVEPNTTHFYAAFPYSTQGVYNRNLVNRVAYNEPKPMEEFTAECERVDASTCKIAITAKLPTGVEGAVIRKGLSWPPIDETDGEEFLTITGDGTYIDEDVAYDTTYYYTAFPYTANGVYNRNPDDDSPNVIIITPKSYEYYYGYNIDLTDSNPATRVTYPYDVDNAGFTSAAMDFTASTFNYGGWPSEPGDKFMPRPCMLKYDGTVDYYLNPDNYTLKEDGTASDIKSTSYGGNAMVEWPKIYTKRWEENGVYHFRCSDSKIDDDYECWCNYDKNNNEIDHFYTSIYTGVSNSSKLRSLSGITRNTDPTIANNITYAKNNGDDWHIEVLSDRLLIQDLLVMITKTTDVASVCGQGVTSGTTHAKHGSMDSKGLFWGSKGTTSGVKVFGMENYWGDAWRAVAGWIGLKGHQKVKITRGTHDGSTVTDYNTTGSGYITVTSTKVTASLSGNGNFNTVTPYGRFSTSASGSTTTYECDAFAFLGSDYGNDVYYALVGGYYTSGKSAGPFAVYLNKTTSETGTCAALSCKPSTI